LRKVFYIAPHKKDPMHIIYNTPFEDLLAINIADILKTKDITIEFVEKPEDHLSNAYTVHYKDGTSVPLEWI